VQLFGQRLNALAGGNAQYRASTPDLIPRERLTAGNTAQNRNIIRLQLEALRGSTTHGTPFCYPEIFQA
jgi:hypothetical protein